MTPAISPMIYVVDDDPASCRSLCALLNARGFPTESFESPRDFLQRDEIHPIGCIITDFRMPDIDGLQFQSILRTRGVTLPIIVISGYASVAVTVRALHQGAVTLLEKPLLIDTLISTVNLAIHRCTVRRGMQLRLGEIQTRLKRLSPEEVEVMKRMLQGSPNKVIAQELQISTRTVDRRRHDVMRLLNVTTVPDLVLMIAERDRLQEALQPQDSSDELPAVVFPG